MNARFKALHQALKDERESRKDSDIHGSKQRATLFEKLDSLREQHHKQRLEIAEKYVSKKDHAKAMEKVDEDLDYIRKKVDAIADKVTGVS